MSLGAKPLAPPVDDHSAAVPTPGAFGPSSDGKPSPSASTRPSGRVACAMKAGVASTRDSSGGTGSPARRIRSAAWLNHR